MSLIRLQQVNLQQAEQCLLSTVDLQIDAGAHTVLLGRNGAGKSTLLRLLAGEIEPDSGQVQRRKNLRVAYLAQTIPDNVVGTVYSVVAAGLGETGRLLEQYYHLSKELQREPTDERLSQLMQLHQQLELQQAWQVQHRIERVLTMLQLEAELEFTALSGGVQRRVLLAKVLLQEPELLLLDEPTNHLDINNILWLQDFLRQYRGAYVVVTHDRMLMQSCGEHFIELEDGALLSWEGDYAGFLRFKEQTAAAQETQTVLLGKKLVQEEAWLRQGVKARRKRNQGRLQALHQLRKQYQQRQTQLEMTKIKSHSVPTSGKLIFDLEQVSYYLECRCIINGLTTQIVRGDKIGIVGPNGCGKTTLIRLLLGQLIPTQGVVRCGTNLDIAYFDQLHQQLELDKSVQDNVGGGKEQVTINGQSQHIIRYLQDFLFTPQRARTQVKYLSGGERQRVLLAKLLIKPANVLVLDEPSNNLDVETLELLEEYLFNYAGTLLLVSHDRAFLNNLVTSTFVFGAGGEIREYVGGEDMWLSTIAATAENSQIKLLPIKKEQTAKQNKASKLSYHEQRELVALPERISTLEKNLTELQQALSVSDAYQKNTLATIIEMQQKIADLNTALEQEYVRWEELEHKQSRLNGQ